MLPIGTKLYTAAEKQEYTKECVRAALKEYVGKKASSIISRVVK
ncbi:hypothetical protein [Lactococcus taiwanensis]